MIQFWRSKSEQTTEQACIVRKTTLNSVVMLYGKSYQETWLIKKLDWSRNLIDQETWLIKKLDQWLIKKLDQLNFLDRSFYALFIENEGILSIWAFKSQFILN